MFCIFRSVLRKKCPENMQQIYTKTPNQNAILIKLLSKFIEIALQYGCPLLICHIFSEHLFLRTPLQACFCLNHGKHPWLLRLTAEQRYHVWEKSMKKNTCMHRFANQADFTSIGELFQLYMKWLEGWRLNGAKIRWEAIPYVFPSIFPHISSCFI